jgi:DNA-binding winged helix-turn-helix (wHTH) protein
MSGCGTATRNLAGMDETGLSGSFEALRNFLAGERRYTMLGNQTQRQIKSYRPMTYCLGRFKFHPNEWLLTLEGVAVPIGIRAANILLALIERPGEIISHHELTKSVWQGQFIHEGNLRSQMCVLRKVLADGFDGVAPIKTVPQRGYVFVAHVICVDEKPPAMDRLSAGNDSVVQRYNLPRLGRVSACDEVAEPISSASPEDNPLTINTSEHIVVEIASLIENLLGRFQSLKIIVVTREL